MTNYTSNPTNAIQRFDFHGTPLTRYMHEGRACLIMSEVGAALGYTPEGFRRSVQNWRGELIPGTDFRVISPGELDGANLAPSTRRASVLYESGLHLVCLKTEKPQGRELRRYLAEHVLPVLVRGGKVEAPDALATMEARIAALETRSSVADPYLRDAGQWNPRNTVDNAIWALADARAELASLKADAYRKPSFAGAQTSILRAMRTEPDEPPVMSYLFLRSSQVGRVLNAAAQLLEHTKIKIEGIKMTPTIDDVEFETH